MSSKRTFFILAILGLVAISGILPGAAHAQGTLSASPSSGPAGTVFVFTASGLTPGAKYNVYAVEPDGIASDNCYNYLTSVCNGGNNFLTASANGTASFVWVSDLDGFQSQGLGKYTWVLHPVGVSGLGSDAQTSVYITGGGGSVSGASLSVSPARGRVFTFSGSGFAANEIVNLWTTLPVYCSSDFIFYPSQTINTGTVKADNSGSFKIVIGASSADFVTSVEADCTGSYSLDARGSQSGKGASVSFEVTGNAVTQTAGTSLTVTPLNGSSGGADPTFPLVLVQGSGYGGGETVTCWSTRPDGRTYAEFNVKTSSAGTFAVVWAVGYSWIPGVSSEEPGNTGLTCQGNSTKALAVVHFWIGPAPGSASSTTTYSSAYGAPTVGSATSSGGSFGAMPLDP